MPTATPFTALGAGNGFPFCPPKVNIADHDYWTTLSGWSKVSTPADDAAKAASINESLQLAMKLFWNFNGLSVANNGTNPNGSSFSFPWSVDMEAGVGESESIVFVKIGSPYSASNENKTPRERVCYKRFSVTDEFGSSYLGVGIVRMYNGVTTDEGNFVGYGTDNPLPYITSVYSEFALFSYIDEGFVEDEAFQYITIDGFDFIAWAIPFNNLDSPISITSSGSSVTASFDYTDPEEETVTISDLDFYTY